MPQADQYLLTIAYQSQAILLYNELKKKGYDIKVVATPCSLGNGCSKSIRCSGEILERVKEEAKKNNIVIKGIYKILKNPANQTYYLKVQGPNS